LTDKSRREKINELIAYDEGIAMASEVLLSISRDDAERARLASEYKYAVDTQSKVVQAKREGMQEGEKKGEKNKAIETARKMKADNMPVSLVVKYTGLTDQQVEDL
jgi:predicted transposase/invertase (TIGR01784 family)